MPTTVSKYRSRPVRSVPRAPSREMRLDLWGASRKSGLLAKVAGVPVHIIAPDGTIVTHEGEEET